MSASLAPENEKPPEPRLQRVNLSAATLYECFQFWAGASGCGTKRASRVVHQSGGGASGVVGAPHKKRCKVQHDFFEGGGSDNQVSQDIVFSHSLSPSAIYGAYKVFVSLVTSLEGAA